MSIEKKKIPSFRCCKQRLQNGERMEIQLRNDYLTRRLQDDNPCASSVGDIVPMLREWQHVRAPMDKSGVQNP